MATVDEDALLKASQRINLLESEVAAIKKSKAYKLSRAAGVLRNRMSTSPLELSYKIVHTLLTHPRKILRIISGQNTDTDFSLNVNAVVNNDVRSYHDWIILYEPDENDLELQKQQADKFKYKPLISVITPVFNPPTKILGELIESLLAQTYPHFEICFGNFGDSIEIKEMLRHYQRQDKRIKVYTFTTNLGIAGNSNLIFKKAQGDYIALLDHDDTLSPDALFENVKLLNEKHYDFIYSDKDKIDDNGHRFDPLFKPDWSPEILLNINYLTHLNLIKRAVVKEIGGWDSTTDGAQDWDLFLRIVARTKSIAHIPKVLYHWRVISSSTAFSIETKPYALEGQRRALEKYLDSKRIAATPYHRKTELLLRWEDQAIDTVPTVVLIARNHSELIRMMRSIKFTLSGQHCRYIFVHYYKLEEFMKQSLPECNDWIYSAPGLHVKAMKKVVSLVRGDKNTTTVLFINCALRLVPSAQEDWYADLTGWLSISGVGAVGAKILDKDNLVVDSGGVIIEGEVKPIFHGHAPYQETIMGNVEWVRDLHWISKKLYAVKKSALLNIEWSCIDADTDSFATLMFKLTESGHRLVYNPNVIAYDTELTQANVDELGAKVFDWQSLFKATNGCDPYSNPNLDPNNPMKLKTVGPYLNALVPPTGAMVSGEMTLATIYDLTSEDINHCRTSSWGPVSPGRITVGWFLPSFDAIYAGLNNIFSFAEYQKQENHKLYFFIETGRPDVSKEKKLIVDMYPSLKGAQFIPINPQTPLLTLPKLDIGICTLWSTAYTLAKYANVNRRCYFIQDNEANFYPQGTLSALVTTTYNLGLFAITGTEGLLNMYCQKYGGSGIVLRSKVNLKGYLASGKSSKTPKIPYRVFFYGRPNMARNAFELGLAGLRELKRRLGDEVIILSAGAEWNASDYGVEGIVDNLGKIPYDMLPKFYKGIDVGLMFMYSGHPGVVASELMASGCPMVVNRYVDETWQYLYRHEETCLTTQSTASCIAESIMRLLTDQKLRNKIIPRAQQVVAKFYDDYQTSCAKVLQAITRE